MSDQSGPSYPAFRAWIARLIACYVVGIALIIGAQVALARWLLPDGWPTLLVAAAQLAAGVAAAEVVYHVVQVLLHDRREAVSRELVMNRVELERRWGPREGGGDGTA